MNAKYILAVVAVLFAAAAARRFARDGELRPQTRTWLLVSMICGAVTTWLFTRG